MAISKSADTRPYDGECADDKNTAQQNKEIEVVYLASFGRKSVVAVRRNVVGKIGNVE